MAEKFAQAKGLLMIRLVTDSGASLPSDFLEQHDIIFIKGRIDFGGEVILDSPPELTTADFYRRLTEVPSTAASARLDTTGYSGCI